MWNGFRYKLKRALTRPRVFVRSWQALGLGVALSLVRIRLGSRDEMYRIQVPQWQHPVYIRGGDSTDAVVLYEILVTDEYGLVGNLGKPEFMIDGGSNIGLASVHFLNLYPDVHIVAIEPDAKTTELCRRNLAPYANRTTVLQGAVWDRTGRLVLQSNYAEWASTVRSAKEGEDAGVEAFTVPSIIAEYGKGRGVDLLKLDVEGSEKDIFAPGSEQWLPEIKNIVIELHGPDCEERFFSAIKPYSCEMASRDSVYFCGNLQPRTGVNSGPVAN